MAQTDYGASLRSAAGASGHVLGRNLRALGRAQAWAETTRMSAEASVAFHSRAKCISRRSLVSMNSKVQTVAYNSPKPQIQGFPGKLGFGELKSADRCLKLL